MARTREVMISETTFLRMYERADREPIGVDISDYGDEFCEGFLRGQANVLEEIAREAGIYLPLHPIRKSV